jgi:hypothetical protein
VAIRPPSDLVLDVAAAAHPARLKEAQARLEKVRADAPQEKPGKEFEPRKTFEPEKEFNAALQAASAISAPRAVSPPPATFTEGKPQDKAKAMEKLEAFFLRTVVDEIMPKDAESVFGSGTAGSVWKSMLAEQVANELAKSARFGIAERLAGNHFTPAPQKLSMTSNGIAGSGETTAHENLPFLRERRTPQTPAEDILSTGRLKPGRS